MRSFCRVLSRLALAIPLVTWGLVAQEVITITEAFDASGGVSVADDGRIFVADFGDNLGNANGTRVYQVSLDGSYSEFASGLQGASGNEFDSQGNLFQSNIQGWFISKIDTQGNVNFFTGGHIYGPVGIAIDANDTVYVANCMNAPAIIAKITPEGSSSIFVQSGLLDCPNGLTIDNDGNLYACNFNNGNVVKITPDQQVSVLAEIPGGRNGHITFANERLYVVARCANQIYEVSLEGKVTLLAGTGARGNDDGPALEATFNLANGIAPSPDGDTLYINDAVSLAGDCLSTPLNPILVRMIVGVKGNTNIGEPLTGQLQQFRLNQNYPNPFNPETSISFDLSKSDEISIFIYDVSGKRIKTLLDGQRYSAGSNTITWDGTDNTGTRLTSGVYFYRMQTSEGYTKTRKMALIR